MNFRKESVWPLSFKTLKVFELGAQNVHKKSILENFRLGAQNVHKNFILENFRLGAKNVHKPPPFLYYCRLLRYVVCYLWTKINLKTNSWLLLIPGARYKHQCVQWLARQRNRADAGLQQDEHPGCGQLPGWPRMDSLQTRGTRAHPRRDQQGYRARIYGRLRCRQVQSCQASQVRHFTYYSHFTNYWVLTGRRASSEVWNWPTKIRNLVTKFRIKSFKNFRSRCQTLYTSICTLDCAKVGAYSIKCHEKSWKIKITSIFKPDQGFKRGVWSLYLLGRVDSSVLQKPFDNNSTKKLKS